MSIEQHHTQSDQLSEAKLLQRAPQEVIDLLDAETTIEVEELVDILNRCHEVALLTNPFERESHVLAPGIDNEVFNAIEEVDRTYDLIDEDPTSDSVTRILRQQAPVLANGTGYHVGALRSLDYATVGRLNEISVKINEVLAVDSEDKHTYLHDLKNLHGELVETAVFPGTRYLNQVGAIAEAEGMALHLDARTVGAQKTPQLAADLIRAINRHLEHGLSRRKSPTKADPFEESYKDIVLQLVDIGSKDRKVRRAHRDEDEINQDEDYIKLVPERIRDLKKSGSLLHTSIGDIVKEVVVAPANHLFTRLRFINELNPAVLKQHLERGNDPEAYQAKALLVEQYVATYAKQLEAILRAVGVKPETEEKRKQIRRLQATPLNDEFRRAARRAAQEPANSLEGISPDLLFRRATKEAKDILHGGRRIDHPDAANLADELHRLILGSEGKLRFKQAESGLVIAILTGKLQTLVATVERVKQIHRGYEDVQVLKLRKEQPEQFSTIDGFNLKDTVERLKEIFDNPFHCNRMINILKGDGITRVKEEIEKLVQQFRDAEAA